MSAEKPLKLDLGAGPTKVEGFTSVDKFPDSGAEVIYDLFEFPWPWADSSVSEIRCSHFFEHVPKDLRPRFVSEMYRVLKPGCEAIVITPHWQSERAYGDPTHEWPPISPFSYLYADKSWREQNGLTYGAYKEWNCDFQAAFRVANDPAWSQQPEEAQAFASRHYANVAFDLFAKLVKR